MSRMTQKESLSVLQQNNMKLSKKKRIVAF